MAASAVALQRRMPLMLPISYDSISFLQQPMKGYCHSAIDFRKLQVTACRAQELHDILHSHTGWTQSLTALTLCPSILMPSAPITWQLNLSLAESVSFESGIQSMILQPLDNDAQAFCMLSSFFATDQDVIENPAALATKGIGAL